MGSKLSERDIGGKKYSMLTAVRLVESVPRMVNGSKQGYKHMVLWRCDCSNEKVINLTDVSSLHTSSCGCIAAKRLRERSYKHGHAMRDKLSPTFISWCAMIDRCNLPSSSAYRRYGAVGIRVCDRWQGDDGFSNFVTDMGERPEGHTIDRIDGTKNYYPDNCRWANRYEQANNQKSNVKVEVDGVEMNVSQAMRHFGVYTKSGVYYGRLKRGWSVEATFKTPTN